MSDFKNSRDLLDASLNLVAPDGPEWIKIKAAIAALDQAEVARIERDFSKTSRSIQDAADKLNALIASLKTNQPSKLLDQLTAALREIDPLISNAAALLAGEPATALAGTTLDNKSSFPTPDQPSVPPVREFARDLVQPVPAAADARTVDRMIEDILRREGGFVDHPADRGGPTNFGITLRTLAGWRKPREVSRDDVRRLDRSEAATIYKTNYFVRPKIDRLPLLLQPIMFDMSINHGPGTAIKLLQTALCAHDAYRCDIDGGIGEQTIGAAQRAAAALGRQLVNELVDRRQALFEEIADRDPSQKVFLVGWLRRAEEFRATA